MERQPILELRDISVRFGGVHALESVSLAAQPGTITGLIGPNGAGKTTCFNVVTGLQEASRGSVVFEGRDITRARPHVRARMGIGRTFQRLETFRTLTARENVLVAAEMAGTRGSAAESVATELLARVGVTTGADERVEKLSTGTQRLIELARALAASPRLLLLDEPSSGLDERETDEMVAVLRQLSTEDLAILAVEHDMPFIMDLCSTIHVLELGTLLTSGTPVQVQADPLVRAAYLGEGGPANERAPVSAAVSPSVGAPARAASDEVVLALDGVRAGYGEIEVLHDVSLELHRGEVLALLGPNGAGKTTSLKVLSGEVRPTSGRVRCMGQDATGWHPQALVKRGLCCVPEGRSIFPSLTVAENVLMYTHAGIDRRRAEELTYERFPVLGERRQQLAGTLSGGEQQMLALARGLCVEPQILLLDELSMGLAPMIVEELYGVVTQVAREEDLAIVVVEQFVHDVLQIADHAVVMVHGQVELSGAPADIAGDMDAAYLALRT